MSCRAPLHAPARRKVWDSMDNRIRRLFSVLLVGLLSTTVSVLAERFPQASQESDQTQPPRTPDDTQQSQPTATSPADQNPANPSRRELPDAPTPAQPVQQKQSDTPAQTQNSPPVPTGAAAAKAAPAGGAPAARPVGTAIAPAKQRERRSLLIKVGLVAGACVAVGSAVALSKASPSKPPGAP